MRVLKMTIALILLGFICKAQNDDKIWTLRECIDYAIKNNITVKRSDLDIIQNQASLNQSKAALAPSLNGQANHTYNFGQNVNPVTNAITDLDSRTNTFGVNANVTLFDGFANYNSIKQNRFLVEASLASLSQARNDIGLNVSQAYLDIILNEELLDASESRLASSKEQVRRSNALVKNGAAPIADKLQAEAQMATNETQVITNQNNLALSKLRLQQLLQLPYDPAFNIQVPEFDVENVEPVQISSGEVYETALETQPIITAADYQLQAGELGVAVAKGGRLPSITAFARVDTRFNDQNPFSFSDQLDNNLGQNIGLSLTVPIFNNFRVRQSIQNAEINKERASLRKTEVENELRQQVEQAHLNAKAALQTYLGAERQVESTRLLFENLQKQREVGGANITDYTVAENNYNQALSDFIRAKYDYIFKLKILDFYQGKPLEF